MSDDAPLEARFVVWPCDHCRNGIEFDAVQLAGREACSTPCPHCGKETSLREPPPPPKLLPDEGWTLPAEATPPMAEPVPAPPPVALRELIEALGQEEAPPAITSPPLTEQLAAQTSAPPASDSPAIPPAKMPPPVVAPVARPTPPVAPAPAQPKPIMVTLPPDPPPPVLTRAPVDVRWLTDLGVVYFRQHQFHEAFLCFHHAAQQGFATAQFCLAVCYFNGQGITQDAASALPWLQKAAVQGDANAEFTLGLAYRLGQGVAADESLAVQWLRQAASHGHDGAIKYMGADRKASQPAGKTSAPPQPAGPPAGLKPARTAATPQQDLQRMILGIFGRGRTPKK